MKNWNWIISRWNIVGWMEEPQELLEVGYRGDSIIILLGLSYFFSNFILVTEKSIYSLEIFLFSQYIYCIWFNTKYKNIKVIFYTYKRFSLKELEYYKRILPKPHSNRLFMGKFPFSSTERFLNSSKVPNLKGDQQKSVSPNDFFKYINSIKLVHTHIYECEQIVEREIEYKRNQLCCIQEAATLVWTYNWMMTCG